MEDTTLNPSEMSNEQLDAALKESYPDNTNEELINQILDEDPELDENILNETDEKNNKISDNEKTEEELTEEPTEDPIEESTEEPIEEPIEEPELKEKVVKKLKTLPKEESKDIITRPDSDTAEESIKFRTMVDALENTTYKVKGKEIPIQDIHNIEDIIQKGLGFGKNRQDYAKTRRILQSFEDNGITSEEDYNTLIDAFKGNADAIKSLVSKHKVDLDLFDTDEKVDYNPNNNLYSQDSSTVAVTLNEYKDTENFNELVSTTKERFGSEQDLKFISQNPNFIEMLQSHIQSGFYEQAIARVKDVRSMNLGIPKDVPDSQIYYVEVMQALEAQNSSKSKEDINTTPVVSKKKEEVISAYKKTKTTTGKTITSKPSKVASEMSDSELDNELKKIYKNY